VDIFSENGRIKGSPRCRVLLLLVLTLGGLLGNYFKYPIFLNIDFLFGSIFAMIILQVCGFGRGIAASLIISSYTYFLWNHPYAIVIMTGETIVVGWLTGKQKLGFVLADTLYWLCIGIPLVYLFYGVVMGATGSLHITMVKQAMNGITNALIARLLFSLLVARTRTFLLPLREVMVNLLAAFILFPSLIILMLSSRADFREADASLRNMLHRDSESAANLLHNWLNDRRFAIMQLALVAASGNHRETQLHLDQLRKTDANIERCGFLDKDATIVAYSPLVDELGHDNIGRNFADRPHIEVMKQTLAPLLTEIMLGRLGIAKPIILMAAPVIVENGYGGYVTTIFHYEHLSTYLQSVVPNNQTYILVDRNDRVIATNRPDQTIMSVFDRGDGKAEQLEQGLTAFVAKMSKNTPISERWKKSLYIAEKEIGAAAEWKLILEQSIAPVQKALFDRYTRRLISLFVVLLAGLGFAELLSRRMVVTMERLSTLTCDLPEKLQDDHAILNWPRSSAFEVDRLIANFSRMADSLGYQFALVKENNASLENRVAERTDELLESRNLFHTLADYAPVGIFQTNAFGACTFVNKKWCQLTGLTEQQALGQGWISALHPEDRQRVVDVWYGAVASKEEFQAEYRFLHADAQVVFVQGNAVEVYREETGVQHYIGCVVDITERKKAMEEVSQAKETAIAADQAKSRLLRTVAHEFRTPLSLLVSSLDILDRYGKNLGEEQRKTQEKYIRSASSQLSELVNAVSSYNQKEVAQQLESWTMEKISTLCRTVGEEIAAGWSVDHRLQLSFSPEQGRVDMNEPLFRRIFGNLMVNAFQYSPAGGLIQVQAYTIGRWLHLDVQDQGTGIAAEDRERVFESFYRGSNTTGKRGMGLGLGIAREAAEHLGGTLELVQTIGPGTTFQLKLPCRVTDPLLAN